MTWALWLAVPVVATSLAAVWAWWRGWRGRKAQRRAGRDRMRAHREYLDALVIPARSADRGMVRATDTATDTEGRPSDAG